MPQKPRYEVRKSGSFPNYWRVHDTRLRSIVKDFPTWEGAHDHATWLNAEEPPTRFERLRAWLSNLTRRRRAA